MLCRVLVAAVVVICTLLRIHAHGQSTQRLNQIKDLMCVFLMSGMQKEDLDVSMLTKLQRHNVNIDDLNNEKLLKECIQSHSNKIEFINVTANQPVHKSVPLIESDKEIDDFNNTNVLKTRNDFSTSKVSLNNVYDNRLKVKDLIQYNDGRPKLESVLSFWEDMGINKAITESIKLEKTVPTRHITKNSIYKPVKQNKESILDSLFNADAINTLLVNFLTKRTSSTTTTQKSVDLDDIYKKIFSLQRHDIERMSDINPAIDNHSPYLSPQLNQRFTSIRKEKDDKQLDVKEVLRTPYITRGGHHIPETEMKENPYLFNNIYLEDFKKSEPIETTTNKDPKYAISRDTIKEIAESVKELILRDLRKEMRETTILTSTKITTTFASTTEISSKAKTDSITQRKIHTDIKSQESIMNKFLQLFEEIKSLKQNAIVIISEQKKDLEIQKKPNKVDDTKIEMAKTLPQAIEMSALNSIPPKLPYNNQIFGTTQYSMLNSDKIFNFAPQLHKYRSNDALSVREPLKIIKPITVQTNNLEIPPLGIRLNKPQSLIINQNIIVTTSKPYRIVANIKEENQRDGQHINFHQTNPDTAYQSNQAHVRLHSSKLRYETPIHRIHPNHKDDVIRFTLNNNDHSKYNSDYYEKVNLGKFNLHSDSAAYGFKQQDTPSFHEKLEKVGRFPDSQRHNKYTSKVDCCNEKYAYSQAMADCCNRKIASRHQMSYNNMKKNSYDDTHYKNFLKSQQKVNDMLEKILSDKGHVQSVETA